MKRLLTALTVLLLFGGSTFGQSGGGHEPFREEIYLPIFEFGGRSNFGMTTISYTGDDPVISENFDYRMTGSLGGWFNFNFEGAFAGFQIEGIYVPRGARANYTSAGVDVEQIVNLTYVEIPLTVKFRDPLDFLPGKLFAGASYNIKLKEEVVKNEVLITLQNQEFFESSDINFVFGWEILLGNIVRLDMRYNMGYQDVNLHEAAEYRNDGFWIGLGFRYLSF